MSKLTNKVALVTGGSRGIGAAIAKRLAADGASVALTYTKGKEPADAVVKAIEAAGGKALAIQADSADADAVTKAVNQAAKHFGRLDILVNNAGIAAGSTLEATSLEDFDRLYAVNVRGTFVAIQAALKHIGDGGRIINIGSCLGERVAFPGVTAYSSTKGAIKILTQGLSREVGGRGITVNNVQPGPIDTDMNPGKGDGAAGMHAMIPIGRHGHVDELAAMVAFVASPDASFANGASLTVDGGTNA
ncbi:MAG: short-chain dehydrogenase/reductase [Phycisphaerales bacterium]|nr:short-chain dehydrogenase/reductase [Phycisphaerales bacterium]